MSKCSKMDNRGRVAGVAHTCGKVASIAHTCGKMASIAHTCGKVAGITHICGRVVDSAYGHGSVIGSAAKTQQRERQRCARLRLADVFVAMAQGLMQKFLGGCLQSLRRKKGAKLWQQISGKARNTKR